MPDLQGCKGELKHNQSNCTHQNHSRLALRGALSAATATAVLLGGFGAFALWQDNIDLATSGAIQTGSLKILNVDEKGWVFAGDEDGNNDGLTNVGQAIDLASFKVSPGDVLEWQATVTYEADGDDLRGQFSVDKETLVTSTESAIDGYVTVETVIDGDNDATFVGDSGTHTVPVSVKVSFSRELGEDGTTGQDLAGAVTLDQLALKLVQVSGN